MSSGGGVSAVEAAIGDGDDVELDTGVFAGIIVADEIGRVVVGTGEDRASLAAGELELLLFQNHDIAC